MYKVSLISRGNELNKVCLSYHSKSYDSPKLYLESPEYVLMNQKKKNLDSYNCIIMLDFAENC